MQIGHGKKVGDYGCVGKKREKRYPCWERSWKKTNKAKRQASKMQKALLAEAYRGRTYHGPFGPSAALKAVRHTGDDTPPAYECAISIMTERAQHAATPSTLLISCWKGNALPSLFQKRAFSPRADSVSSSSHLQMKIVWPAFEQNHCQEELLYYT